MKAYPAYKDSGIEWIGEIPEHWEVKPLKYTVKINQDSLPENTHEDYEIQYIDIGNVNQDGLVNHPKVMSFGISPSRARRVVKKGDTIVSTVRTYLKAISYINSEAENLIASTGFAVLTPTDLMSAMYLYCLISTQKIIDTISSLSVGVSYPAINSSDLGSIPIWFPKAIEEQQSIANFLDRKTNLIDSSIEKKQKQIALLKEQRAAIINQAVTKGLDPAVKLKDSGIEWLGEIPEHWDVKKLKWVVKERLKYGANESAELDDKKLPRYIRITDFDEDGRLRAETFRSLPFEKAEEYLLKEGDILFARSGATVGKTFQFKNYEGVACFAGYLIKATVNEKVILSDYLYLYTKSNRYENWKNRIFIQATIQNIGADKYQMLEVTIPPLNEQKNILNYVHEKLKKIQRIYNKTVKQIDHLKEYRTTLISEVVTGKIDVRDYGEQEVISS